MLLTLDLARRIGWTLGDPADPNFRSGVHVLPSTGADLGQYLSAFHDWIIPTLSGVTSVVLEAPVLVGRGRTRIETTRQLIGLAGHTEFVCARKSIKVREVGNSSVKLFLAGSGRAEKGEMVAACRDLGYKPIDHNEADAIAIRLYTLSHTHPEICRKIMGRLT